MARRKTIDPRLPTEAAVIHSLATNPAAVAKALTILYGRQTSDEQRTDDTRHENRRGFSKAHAEKFSSMARYVQTGRVLTPRQLAFLQADVRGKPRIACYAKQLIAAKAETLAEADHG